MRRRAITRQRLGQLGIRALALSLCPGALLASASDGFIRQAVAELDPTAVSLEVNFGVETATGKAWAEIIERGRDTDAMPTVRHVDVTGLHFDVKSAAVVLQRRGDRAVCARQVAAGWWSGGVRLEPTGHCRWAVEPRGSEFDNGFEIAANARPVLVLVARAAGE